MNRCTACSGGLIEELPGPGEAPYVRCLECRSLYRAGTLVDGEIEGWYDSDYRPDDGRYVRPLRFIRSLMWRRVARNLDSIMPPGMMVDVGAGDGDLALALRRRGRACIALDPYSRSKHVERRHLCELAFEQDVAGLVYWHSFEHLADPSAELVTMASLLPQGGMLLLGLPNPCSIQARLMGGRWNGLDKGRHLHVISPDGLAALLWDHGFEVVPRAWRGGDCGQSLIGWLSALLSCVGWSSRADELVLAKCEARPLGRLFGLALGACLIPAAAGLTALEVLLGRPGSTTIIARSSKEPPEVVP